MVVLRRKFRHEEQTNRQTLAIRARAEHDPYVVSKAVANPVERAKLENDNCSLTSSGASTGQSIDSHDDVTPKGLSDLPSQLGRVICLAVALGVTLDPHRVQRAAVRSEALVIRIDAVCCA